MTLFSTVGGMERGWLTIDPTDEIWASLLVRAVAPTAGVVPVMSRIFCVK